MKRLPKRWRTSIYFTWNVFPEWRGDFGCVVNVIEQPASTFNKFNLVTKLAEPTIVCWAFMDYLDAAKNSVLLLFTYCIHHRILAKELTSNRLFFVYFYQTDRSQKVKLSDLSCNAKQQYCAQPSWCLKVTSCLVIKMGSVFFGFFCFFYFFTCYFWCSWYTTWDKSVLPLVSGYKECRTVVTTDVANDHKDK